MTTQHSQELKNKIFYVYICNTHLQKFFEILHFYECKRVLG